MKPSAVFFSSVPRVQEPGACPGAQQTHPGLREPGGARVRELPQAEGNAEEAGQARHWRVHGSQSGGNQGQFLRMHVRVCSVFIELSLEGDSKFYFFQFICWASIFSSSVIIVHAVCFSYQNNFYRWFDGIKWSRSPPLPKNMKMPPKFGTILLWM